MARCALELFGINGYKQTTIAEIARSAGYHVQTFYRHFLEEELVAEIWRQSYEQFTHFESRGVQLQSIPGGTTSKKTQSW